MQSSVYSLTTKDKLLWLQHGNWSVIFKKIDSFLSDLITYRMKQDKKSEATCKPREESANKDKKINKGVVIYKTK